MNKYEVASTRYQKIIDFLEHEISLKGDLILNVNWTDLIPFPRRQRGGEKSSAPSWSAQPLPVLSQAWQVDRG